MADSVFLRGRDTWERKHAIEAALAQQLATRPELPSDEQRQKDFTQCSNKEGTGSTSQAQVSPLEELASKVLKLHETYINATLSLAEEIDEGQRLQLVHASKTPVPRHPFVPVCTYP